MGSHGLVSFPCFLNPENGSFVLSAKCVFLFGYKERNMNMDIELEAR